MVVVVVDYYLCLLIVTNTHKYTHAQEEVKEGRTVCVYSIRGAQGAKKNHRVPPTATTHSTHFCATWAQRSHSKTQNCEIVFSQTKQQPKGGVEKQKAAANKIPIGNVWLYDLQWRLFYQPNLGSSVDRVKMQDARAVKYNLKTTDINTYIALHGANVGVWRQRWRRRRLWKGIARISLSIPVLLFVFICVYVILVGYVICSVSVCLCVVFKTGARTGDK